MCIVLLKFSWRTKMCEPFYSLKFLWKWYKGGSITLKFCYTCNWLITFVPNSTGLKFCGSNVHSQNQYLCTSNFGAVTFFCYEAAKFSYFVWVPYRDWIESWWNQYRSYKFEPKLDLFGAKVNGLLYYILYFILYNRLFIIWEESLDFEFYINIVFICFTDC